MNPKIMAELAKNVFHQGARGGGVGCVNSEVNGGVAEGLRYGLVSTMLSLSRSEPRIRLLNVGGMPLVTGGGGRYPHCVKKVHREAPRQSLVQR